MNCISRNCLLLVVLTCLFPFFVFAEIPAGYYDDAVGKSGEDLQKSLSTILNDATDVGYDGLWNLYKTTDRRSDGKVWDMYSDVTNYTFGTDQCGSYGVEGDCYNREHSVPKSWFSERSPMKSDVWHVYPTDGKINGMRSNNPFGEVGSGASSSKNGFSKWGKCVTPGYSGTVFEPNDEYKGDFARTYFYFATRYQSQINNWGGIFISSYPHIVGWQLNMLLRWHEPLAKKNWIETKLSMSRGKGIGTRLSIIPNWSISSLETVVISPLCQMEEMLRISRLLETDRLSIWESLR